MECNELSTKQSGGYKKISRRWKKNQSGNPAGRPPKLPSLEKILSKEILSPNRKGTSPIERCVTNLLDSAISGNVEACATVLRLIYGKAEPAAPVSPQRA
jgi:Family of unknown function (DUF5681)